MVAPHPPATPDTSLDHARFDPAQRARALQEALPYILEFAGKTLVIKCGGQVMTTPTLAASFARDVVLVHSVGARPVVVHGGGPQIDEHLAKLGKHSEFRNGLRVTDTETLEVARMVLVGKVGREIISLINTNGGSALGISGEDGAMVTATALSEELGYVGEITAVDSAFVNKLLDIGVIPVVSSIATGSGGQAYNINADTMASALASSLNAAKLVCLTDVAGIFADPPTRDALLSDITVEEVESMIADGRINGGMIPKARACVEAVNAGVATAHIVDGRVLHAVLLELFTDAGIGTMIAARRGADDSTTRHLGTA